MKKFFKSFFASPAWKKEWVDELNSTLHEAQEGLPANVVVVVTRESDMYAEVLYLLSFLGLILGSVGALLFKSYFENVNDLISLPVMGFAVGSTLYHFRRFFLSRLAPRAIREKVLLRAKASFLDQAHVVKGRLVLFFFSELEREPVILASPDIDSLVATSELRKLLAALAADYDPKKPLKALGPALVELGGLLKIQLGTGSEERFVRSFQSLVGPSDMQKNIIIPIINGSDDIN